MVNPGSSDSRHADPGRRAPVPDLRQAFRSAHQPFCSGRCADIDLGRWLKGAYRVETQETAEESGEDPSPTSRKQRRLLNEARLGRRLTWAEQLRRSASAGDTGRIGKAFSRAALDGSRPILRCNKDSYRIACLSLLGTLTDLIKK